MLLAGDEIGRTQRGNNNGYCQDNQISWMDWSLDPRREGLLEHYRQPNFSASQIWDSDRGAVEELGQGLPGFYDFISNVEAKNVG